jgi:hypothetical protein
MKICPVGAELFMRTDGQTDMKVIVALHYFANAPKNTVFVDTICNVLLRSPSAAIRHCNWQMRSALEFRGVKIRSLGALE